MTPQTRRTGADEPSRRTVERYTGAVRDKLSGLPRTRTIVRRPVPEPAPVDRRGKWFDPGRC
jgi:hypothetical protein